MVLILTGERGAGKSTVSQRTVALARLQAFDCAGIITLRVADETLDVLDIRRGEIRRLTLPPGAESNVVVGPYRFDQATIDWGNDLLRAEPPCDLFVVDELGPLELIKGQGWMAAFEAVRGGGHRAVLVVVRPWLVDRAHAELSSEAVTVLPVTPENRDNLPQEIVSMIG